MPLPPAIEERLSRLLSRQEEVQSLLSEPGLTSDRFTALSREFAELEPIVVAIRDLRAVQKERADLEIMTADAALDPEMKRMALDEFYALQEKLPALERELQLKLLPKDAADEKNAILEVRGGTGGEEASLFAAVLFGMYRKYADAMGWRFEVLDMTETDMGGLKEASAMISGKGVFARLKFESGVHRVQRVPVTEASGRVHTSAATVAVLPEAQENDVLINESDLKIDRLRSGGAGGQHVNKTESAIRITHLPTGIVVMMQEERSQHKNRAKAMTVLQSRLYEQQRQQLHDIRSADRKSQVGSGDRSERIRTYNFPQGRVTDHRINLTLYDIEAVIAGTALDKIVQALITADEAERLAELTG